MGRDISEGFGMSRDISEGFGMSRDIAEGFGMSRDNSEGQGGARPLTGTWMRIVKSRSQYRSVSNRVNRMGTHSFCYLHSEKHSTDMKNVTSKLIKTQS